MRAWSGASGVDSDMMGGGEVWSFELQRARYISASHRSNLLVTCARDHAIS